MKVSLAKQLLKKHGSPLYVYDATIIRERCHALQKTLPTFKWYYACKANTFPAVVKLIHNRGFGMETTSPGEIAVALKVGVPARDITYTCCNITESELVHVVKLGVRVHLDSLNQIEWFGKNFPGREISVRLNTGLGRGVHAHLRTGGLESKFGIPVAHIPRIKNLAKKYNLKITGLHHHIGTTSYTDARILIRAMNLLFSVALKFPDLTNLEFGGGFHVPYRPTDIPIDLKDVGMRVTQRAEKFTREYGRQLVMSFEPGRFPICEAGTLLTTVTDIKYNPGRNFIGIDSGMGHLIRPALYNAYHEIENISRPFGKKILTSVEGNICESGDFFARNRKIARAEIGDIIAIKNAGAYGFVMSSDYNLRARPKEILI